MTNSIEWQLLDFQMWQESQDWKHDAPRYYANDLILKKILEHIKTNADDDEKFGAYVKVVLREYGRIDDGELS